MYGERPGAIGRQPVTKRYTATHFERIEPLACPCGQTRRAFADDPDGTATFHVVQIRTDAQVHYHKRLTEIYYVLEGTGEMELDADRVAVRPGSVVQIKPHCRHRAVGELKVIVVAVPAFDPADEWFD